MLDPGNSGTLLVELVVDAVDVLDDAEVEDEEGVDEAEDAVEVVDVAAAPDSSSTGRMPIGTAPLTDLVVPFSSWYFRYWD